ncbi:MAG: hypothetical protein QMB11_07935 [Nonlabens sp.]|uniref:hypothetical protein n=1 Tax=Nonlabens sp. TaxID=1888209 RepID=UPI0035A6EB47
MLTVPSVYLIAKELSKKELLLLQDKINNDLEEMETTKEVFKKIQNEILIAEIRQPLLEQVFNVDTN